MASYAAGTEVSIIRSIGELEKLVAKHGATGFGYARDDRTSKARVVFRVADRMVRFEIDKPDPENFRRSPGGRVRRTREEQVKLADAEEKRRWRALVHVVSALLVGVTEGIITLSDAFLPYTMLPDGRTVSEFYTPQLDYVNATATMPSLLPGAVTAPAAIEGAVDDVEVIEGGG